MNFEKVNLRLRVSIIILILFSSPFLIINFKLKAETINYSYTNYSLAKQKNVNQFKDYTSNAVPTVPEWNNESITRFTGSYKFEWNASTDDGSVDHYRLEMSKKEDFSIILREWTTTKTSKSVAGLDYGKFFFRVIAIDNLNGESGSSETKELFVRFSFSGLILAIIALVGLSIFAIYRVMKLRTFGKTEKNKKISNNE